MFLQKKAKYQGIAIISVLLLSLTISFLQTSYANANPESNTSTLSKQSNGNLTLTAHKMSVTELDQYQDGIGVYQEGHTYNQLVGGHGTGLSPPTSSQWVDIAKNAYVVDKITYQAPPGEVDQSATSWFPPIGDQGQQGSCASFAIGYYCKTFQEAKEHSWNLTDASWTGGNADGNVSADYQSEVMSPAFVYNLINGGADVGSDFETPIRLLCNVGTCSWQNMPYYWQDYTRWPTENAWVEAPLYRSNSSYSYQYLYADSSQGVTSLKNWLAADNLAVIGIDAYDNLLNFNDNQDLFTTDNYENGGLDHAATIVGYDDLFTYMENGVVHHGAFKIANTWGIGGWETIPDGCYWISYDAMKMISSPDNPAVLFQDLTGYQPQILATFNIAHTARSDCNIIFGLGTPNAPIVTKNFTDYVFGGALPFCSNNIVFDLTEFKTYMTSMYNQPFFMEVYDRGPGGDGTYHTGTINYFAIESTNSTQSPIQTHNGQYVNLSLIYSMAPTTLTVSPTSGSASNIITLNGLGFAGSSINISYLNPITQTWIPIISQALTSENFSYITNAPDLLQNNPAGDNQPLFDKIVFRAQTNDGNSYNTTSSYTEWRRGLTQIGNLTATGLFGNNTDLSSTIFVENGQSITVSGKWFSPGIASFLWDNTSLGTATIDETGTFNANVQVPSTIAGPHNITVNDGNYAFSLNLTRLPKVTDDYTGLWQTTDFPVNLTSDYPISEIYYKINGGATCNVSVNGQPIIGAEGSNNTLEYWGTWDIYGTGNMVLQHNILTGLRLDKTSPQASLQINGGSTTTTSRIVTLSLTADDSTSGINRVRFSNDGTWSQATWQPYLTSKSWQLSSGNGPKTVYCEIQDNAGLTAMVTASITLDTPQLTSTPSSTASPVAPAVPELNIVMVIVTLALLTATFLVALKFRGKSIFDA
jgi:hypothetical protein